MTQKKESSDSELADLIVRAQGGDMAAMEGLYQRFKRPVYNIALRFTYNPSVAEDLLHDIFIKIFDNIQTLDREKAFVGWIYRVAANTCLSYLRSRKKNNQKSISLTDIPQIQGESGKSVERKLMSRPLDEAVNTLSTKLKSVFILHDIQGYKHREIAEILGWSVGTSKSQLFKARMKIRDFLKEKDYF